MTQTSTAFSRAWLVVGIVALVLYCGFPAAMLQYSDGTTLWVEAIWIVPAVIVAAGLGCSSWRFQLGSALVFIGALLLALNTLIYVGLAGGESIHPLAAVMAGSQVTLLVAGFVGLTGTGRLRWGFARWALVLAIPVLLAAAAGAGLALLVDWGPRAAEYPLAESIQYEVENVGFEGVVAAETEGSIASPPAGALRFVGVEEFPWEVRGSFDTSLADAVQAQRSAFEQAGWSVTLGPPGKDGRTMTARTADFVATLTFERDAGSSSEGAGTVVVLLTKP